MNKKSVISIREENTTFARHIPNAYCSFLDLFVQYMCNIRADNKNMIEALLTYGKIFEQT